MMDMEFGWVLRSARDWLSGSGLDAYEFRLGCFGVLGIGLRGLAWRNIMLSVSDAQAWDLGRTGREGHKIERLSYEL
jgi:hypothetical protein